MSETNQHVLDPGADKAFTNDTVNEWLYNETLRSRGLGPEKMLLLAVLQNALEEVDISWLLSDDYGPHHFSFLYTCGNLGLDPDCIRHSIRYRIKS